MICSELGIADCDFTNGAAYVSDWLGKLRDDKKEVFRAASDAQRIADYLLAFHPDYAALDATPMEDSATPEDPSSSSRPTEDLAAAA